MSQPPTPRWTPILEKGIYPLRGPRLKYYESNTRFQIVAAGRRSLKTEIAKRKIAEKFCLNVFLDHKGYFDERYIFSGPTRDQVERIAWEDLQKLIPPKYVKRIWESDLCIESKYGPELWVVGLDRPSRIEGSPLDLIVVDEFPDIPEGAWEANIRPALSDRSGGGILTGVPDFEKPNNQKFQELFELGLSGDNPEYESFTWPSADVLPDSEIISAMNDLSDIMYAQEYLASFMNAPGLAYSKFKRTLHVNEEKTQYDPELNLRISCDFNIGHHNWGIYQVARDGEWHAIDEVYLQNAIVEDMLKELKLNKLEPLRKKKEEYLKRKATLADLNIIFYGDGSGGNRNAFASHTGWRQIRNEFEDERGISYAEFGYRKQGPVVDRINKVNGKLQSADGKIHFYINPKCKNLIRDFEKSTRKMLFSQQKDGDLTHASDNCGYAMVQFND